MKCKLIIQDEVNVKLVGLDVSLRRKLHEKWKKEIQGARFMPAVKLGRWDGKKVFFTLAGATYLNLIEHIIPDIIDAGYDIELEDQRTWPRSFEFEGVDENSFSHHTWPEDHQSAGQPIVLREHQVEAMNTMMANPQSLASLATGSGKTMITACLSSRCEQYGRTLIIVPNKNLVLQTERDYKLLGLDVGVWFGDRKEPNHTHTISTWQSLNVLQKKKNEISESEAVECCKLTAFLEGIVAVIVDECHQISAKVLSELLCGPLGHVPIRWGMTGTIPKDECDRMCLTVCIGEVCIDIPASDLQEIGILSNCDIRVKQLVDHGEYKEYQKELKYLVDNADRMHYVAGMIQEIAKTGNTLVLVDRIVAGEYLCEILTDAPFIRGKVAVMDRKEEYDAISAANNRIIVATYGCAAVGVDIPRLFNVVLIEPGKSFTRAIQSVGRGLRKASDKNHVTIHDITSTLKFSKRHLSKRKQYYKEAKYPFEMEKIDWQK